LIAVSRTVRQTADMKRQAAYVSWHSRMLSELLGQLRAHADLSPKELAARAGISEHTIATCERYCGNLSVDKIFKFIRGAGFDHLTVFYEVEERLELAGKSSLPETKHPRPSVFFKPLYDEGLLDRKEVSRQLRIMRQLRKPARQLRKPARQLRKPAAREH
jgi:DNA-binding XRE family transcriptional regulator